MNYEEVLNLVTAAYRISIPQLQGPSRKTHINQARKMVCLILKHEPKHTVAQLINRSPEIVRHHLSNMLDEIEYYPDLQQKYDAIMSQLEPDMNIKLNMSQLKSLYSAINFYLKSPAETIADELIHLHLDDIAERIRKRIKNNKPNLTLDEKQAKAFTLWHMWNLGKVDSFSQHGAMAMIDIINQIKPVACKT